MKEAISSYDTAFQSRMSWKELARQRDIRNEKIGIQKIVLQLQALYERKQWKSSITKAVMKSLYGRIS